MTNITLPIELEERLAAEATRLGTTAERLAIESLNRLYPHYGQPLVETKVEDRQSTTERAVAEEAPKRLLADELATPHAMIWQEGRIPGSFFESESVGAPAELPRSAPVIDRPCAWDDIRHPDPALGESGDV